MSDKMRNRPSGDQGPDNRTSTENGDNRKRYEGFEGMNYEQIRQPYNPQHIERRRGNSDGHGTNKRRDEL